VLNLDRLQSYLQILTRLERLAKGKDSILLQTYVNYWHKKFHHFYKTIYLHKDVNYLEPSPSISVPCMVINTKPHTHIRVYIHVRRNPLRIGPSLHPFKGKTDVAKARYSLTYLRLYCLSKHIFCSLLFKAKHLS
jgi:hypothetical protein